MSLSERHPVFYAASVSAHRLARRGRWLLRKRDYAARRSPESLPHLVKRHESPLIRKLGTSDLRLQLGKVRNLRLAVPRVDGIIIPPGRRFSFWRAIGPASARRGYAEGMVLWKGEAKAGIGGGLCQLSNHLHWMALHSPLVVAERHHHGFDPFPDDRRVSRMAQGPRSSTTTSTWSWTTPPTAPSRSGCG